MLVGPSGCGKTTLISCIAGILDQDEGECRVFGHDFKSMAMAAQTRLRGQTIGFVFQAFNLLPTLTAAENVSVPLLINGMKRREALTCAGRLERRGAGGTDSIVSPGDERRAATAGGDSGWCMGRS